MNSEQREGAIAALKLGSVWAAVGITSWADFAAFLAALYSILLIGEWLWKKIGRPACESFGWLRKKRDE